MGTLSAAPITADCLSGLSLHDVIEVNMFSRGLVRYSGLSIFESLCGEQTAEQSELDLECSEGVAELDSPVVQMLDDVVQISTRRIKASDLWCPFLSARDCDRGDFDRNVGVFTHSSSSVVGHSRGLEAEAASSPANAEPTEGEPHRKGDW